MNNRPPRRITSDEKEMFLSLKPDDITLELLQNLFADRWDTEKHKVIGSQFETYDEMMESMRTMQRHLRPLRSSVRCGRMLGMIRMVARLWKRITIRPEPLPSRPLQK